MSFDVAAVRAAFPALSDGVAYFDGPGGSQVPRVVADAVADTLCSGISNRGTVTAAERRADGVVTAARAAVADLLGAQPGGVVFGPVDDAADLRPGPLAGGAVGTPATRWW
jgi:selenocysteine lyase/cysteine desulfurase